MKQIADKSMAPINDKELENIKKDLIAFIDQKESQRKAIHEKKLKRQQQLRKRQVGGKTAMLGRLLGQGRPLTPVQLGHYSISFLHE